MDFLRRLFGFSGPGDTPDDTPADAPEAVASNPDDVESLPVTPVPAGGLPCPSCAALLDPPPVRSRLCPSCRQPIVVRRVDGRLALLTRAAVEVFEAERQHDLDVLAWTAARERWLRLAEGVRASPARGARLAAAPISARAVKASRDLYLQTLERAVRTARRELRWSDVGGLRREQARALYEEAGFPVPPPVDITELHREGMIAVLRSFPHTAKHVELVSVGCCPACRADDGKAFVTAGELRMPRLPHAGCPKGLCGCDWWPAVVVQRKRRRRRAATSAQPPPATEPATAPDDGPEPRVPPAPEA